MSQPTIALRAGFIELRLKGSGNTGKGDRYEFISAKDARSTAIKLLLAAERLDSRRVAKNPN